MIQRITLIIVILSILILTLIHLYFWIRLIYCGDSITYTINDKPAVEIKQEPEQVAQVIIKEPQFIKPPIVAVPPLMPTHPVVDVVREYDKRKLYDALEDPTMRTDRHVLGPLEYRRMFNHPTQG